MASRTGVKVGRSGPKSVPTPGIRPSFVLGSRPETLRAPPVPRIKPTAASTRQYNKPEPPSNLASAGDTAAPEGLS